MSIYVYIFSSLSLKRGYIRGYVLYMVFYCMLFIFHKSGVNGRHMRLNSGS